MPGKLAQERVNQLVQEFEACLSVFERARIFTGPSVYFHRKTLAERARYPNIQDALQSDLLFDYLYATLASWGMHRMGNNQVKLCEMETMRNSIQSQIPDLIKLQDFQLTKIQVDQINQFAFTIWNIIKNLKIGIGKAKIVAGSKTLHHLLPELVPPVDREYTLQFFFNNKNINGPRIEAVKFGEIFAWYAHIAHRSLDAVSF